MNLKDRMIKDPVFTKCLGQIAIGVNDGEFNLRIRDARGFNSKTEAKEVDIGKIERALNRRFGDENIYYTIHGVRGEMFASEKNQTRRGVMIQSFCNTYIHEYPERFCNIPLADMSQEEWHDTFIEMGYFLANYLGQKKVVVFFEDLPRGGDVEEHILKNDP